MVTTAPRVISDNLTIVAISYCVYLFLQVLFMQFPNVWISANIKAIGTYNMRKGSKGNAHH